MSHARRLVLPIPALLRRCHSPFCLHDNVQNSNRPWRGNGSCACRFPSRGCASEQMRGEWHGHLSAGSLSIRPSTKASHYSRAECGGEETTSNVCCNIPRQVCACGFQRAQRLQLRRATTLLTDEVMCRSKVLPRQLRRCKDGRRQEWNPLREAVVYSLAQRYRPSAKVSPCAKAIACMRCCARPASALPTLPRCKAAVPCDWQTTRWPRASCGAPRPRTRNANGEVMKRLLGGPH